MNPTVESKRGKDFSKELAARGWYHSFELPDGTRFEGYNTLDILHQRYARFPIPANLHGRRVLDIGAWDGWFSFEAERCGAAVTAIDCVDIPNFRRIHEALGSTVDYRILDFFELRGAGLGRFDFVFFLGVLYHLKHPMLALEQVCALTTDTAIVESFVTDAQTWQESQDKIPSMEFYETDELGNQLDNWFGPGVTCLVAMCRAAGFARVELMYAAGFTAGVACFRKWESAPDPATGKPAPEITGLMNNRRLGFNFSSWKEEEYLAIWFQARRDVVKREDLRLEVGGFGVPALFVAVQGEGTWQANFRLPPGLDPGMHHVRLRFHDSGFGRPWRIAVDMNVAVESLTIRAVRDDGTRRPGEAKIGGVVSLFVDGLAENSDRANTTVWLDGRSLIVDYVGDADGEPEGSPRRQVNARVPSDVPPGGHRLRVECAGVISGEWAVRVL
jgi:tRNA (mo5U34)-methyltransferase